MTTTVPIANLPIDLTELISHVDQLPEEYQTQIRPSLNRVVEYTRRRRRILNLIQGHLDNSISLSNVELYCRYER